MTSGTQSRVTLADYYTSARGVATAIAAVALPFASKVVPSEPSTYFFPPLGDIDGIARIGLVVLCLAVSLLVYFIVSDHVPKSPARVIVVSLVVFVVCLLGYLAAYERFVRRIDIPTRDTTVVVSVGYDRTDFANQSFATKSDWDMLRARGTSDEEIENLWTKHSVTVARLGLFLSCAFMIASALFLFTFAVMHNISVVGASKPATP
jgi:hypothetical protein